MDDREERGIDRKQEGMSANGNPTLEKILESAIVASWAHLVHGAEAGLIGLIHIEYGFAPGGTLDYLKVWSSMTRGHWLLACAYWMSPSIFHGPGIRFANGYASQDLAQVLELVMQHQDAFVLPPNLGRQGLLQISIPTEEKIAAATALVRESVYRLESLVAEPVLV